MPCDQVRVTTIALENADPILLYKALYQLGIVQQENVTEAQARAAVAQCYDGQELRLNRDVNPNRVKVAYSEQVVKKATSKYGWKLKQKAPGKYVATRRA